nr:MAG TPA: PsbA, PsbB, PsbC, PsbD, PsbE-FCP supercomplex, PLANT PROTEIN [Caudoviricetes sp.]DAS71611.1 MAG TPA: PsbA, PsbB, PsbC, PsbD, PsbE-FCP supercomplex, PLANT PROTEIN [Bacteriophage sp.]
MTVEHFLKSLSDLLWSCFWAAVIYNFLNKKE